MTFRFCLYDTKLTDYKTTAPECPYSTNPNAGIVKNLFDASAAVAARQDEAFGGQCSETPCRAFVLPKPIAL